MGSSRDRELGEMLRDARKDAGMTQVELAEVLGVRQGTVSRWEKGWPPGDEYREVIEEALRVDLSPFMDESREAGEEWLPVSSPKDMGRYVISVTKRVLDDEDLRMALILLVKEEWLSHEAWMVMVSRDDLIRELGKDCFDRVWPYVLDSPWVERVSGVEYVLRLRYPSPL